MTTNSYSGFLEKNIFYNSWKLDVAKWKLALLNFKFAKICYNVEIETKIIFCDIQLSLNVNVISISILYRKLMSFLPINRSPGLSNRFVLSKEDELKKRPKFNTMVTTKKSLGGCQPVSF